MSSLIYLLLLYLPLQYIQQASHPIIFILSLLMANLCSLLAFITSPIFLSTTLQHPLTCPSSKLQTLPHLALMQSLLTLSNYLMPETVFMTLIFNAPTLFLNHSFHMWRVFKYFVVEDVAPVDSLWRHVGWGPEEKPDWEVAHNHAAWKATLRWQRLTHVNIEPAFLK